MEQSRAGQVARPFFQHQLKGSLIALLISVVAIGGVIYQVANQSLLEHVKTSMLYHAEFREERIINMFEQQQAWLQEIAGSEGIKRSAEVLFQRFYHGPDTVAYQQASAHFREEHQLLLRSQGVDDLFLLTPSGELAFSLRPMEGEIGVNLSATGFYGETVLSALFDKVVGERGLAISRYGKIDQIEESTVLMGVPLFSSRPGREREISGVMVRPFSLKRLRALLQSYSGLGKSGEVLIAQWRNGVNTEVNFINHFRNHAQREPDANCMLLRRESPEQFPMIHALNHKRGSGWLLDNSCNPVFAVWSWIPELQLGMVVKQDRTEIMLPLERLEREILMAGLVVMLFLLWVVRRQARVMVRPIEQLIDATAQGRIEQLERSTIREVNDLADTLQERTNGLERARRETELILESMDEGLVVVDGKGCIDRVNPKFAQLRGESAQALVGREIDTLFKRDIGAGAEEEHRLISVEGITIPVSIAKATLECALRGQNGEVLVLHDLRAILRAERAVQANRAKDDFLASMSHELRTPLTAIIGNSEMLMAGGHEQFSDQQSRMLRAIEISGRIQLALVNDILDLSKVEAGKLKVDDVDYDLDRLLDELEHIFSTRAQESGIDFRVERLFQLAHHLRGDSRRIGQILTNLMSNAIKFTEQGSVVLKVALDEAEQKLRFSVVDQGMGIAEQRIGRLFKPFEQADDTISHRFGGTGLGLHISRTLAVMMEGEITVESELGRGSTFELQLPYRQGSVLPESESGGQSGPERQQQFSGEVLLAEDTPELQTIVRYILESYGVRVTVAKNGEEAVESALANPYDLILMDMRMPVMDGIEATQILRDRGYRKPIIAHTANVMQKHLEQFKAAGSDDVLSKPVSQSELRRILRRYLQVQSVEEVEVRTEKRSNHSNLSVVAAADFELSDELKQIFTERLGELKVSLQEALSSQSWDQLHDAAHAIKGSGSLYDQPQLSQAGRVVCDALDRGELGQIEQQVGDLIRQIVEVVGE